MGFGAIITTGEGFVPMDDLMQWIVEARVEKELSKEAKFSVRFEDDLCEGEPAVARRDELKANAIIGIFVKAQEKYECLVHGPITRVRTSAMVGGAGSWIEVSGQDRRIEMDRTGVQASWTGLASDAAQGLIEAYGLTADCEETTKEYSEGQNALNQRGTDLAFINDIARKNNMEFWLSYTVDTPYVPLSLPGITPPASYAVTTTVHVKHSPPRSGGLLAALPPILSADESLTINVQPPGDKCPTVTRFDTRIDFERPNAARGFAQDAGSGNIAEQQASPSDAPLDDARDDIVAVDGVERTMLAPAVTDPEEQFLAQEALLTEAAWFVEVDCSSTLELLGFAATPHQIVDVKYAGDRLSGPYQVMAATHVINASDHFIDFKIRANGLKASGGGS